MASWPILSVTTFLPLVGALFIMLMGGEDEAVKRNARWVALWATLITLAVSLLMAWRFDPSSAEFQFVERRPWLAGTIMYHMGVDGISLPFVILTTGLMPICILASWQAIQARVKEYMIAFLVLETLMIGTFSSLDLVLFYLFFEGGLIPMFLIIGVWGGPRRVYASFKFFLYTLAGSVLMLLAIMAMYWAAGTTDIPTLMKFAFPRGMQTWAWLAFLASFAVKLPMWPVHTWLPDAHVEAPTAGSVILAGVLRLVWSHHVTFFINSLAHMWGSRPYTEDNSARDNPVLAVITYGEGYHNFHHIFTHDYRNGVRWWQWDPTKWLIAALQLLGLTRRLKRTPVFQIQRALLAMQFTRAREQLAKTPDAGHSHIEQLRARLAHEYESFLAAVADWARVKEQWLGEKKRAVLEQWEQVDLQSKLREIERRLSQQLRRMRSLQAQLA